jgi:hypothetical protein
MVHFAIDQAYTIRHLSSDCCRENPAIVESVHQLKGTTCIQVRDELKNNLTKTPNHYPRDYLKEQYFNRHIRAFLIDIFQRTVELRAARWAAQKPSSIAIISSTPITAVKKTAFYLQRKALVFDNYLKSHLPAAFRKHLFITKKDLILQDWEQIRSIDKKISTIALGVNLKVRGHGQLIAAAGTKEPQLQMYQQWLTGAIEKGMLIEASYCLACNKPIVNVNRHIAAKRHKKLVEDVAYSAIKIINTHSTLQRLLANELQ